MSLSLKNIIVQAIIKVAGANPALDHVEGQPTAEEARDDFIRLLLLELFPEDPAVPVPPSPSTSDGKKDRKKRAPMTEEQKAAMKAKRDATLAAKKGAEPAAEQDTTAVDVPVAAEPVAEEPKERKKRGPMTEEQKEAMKAKRAATLAAKKGAEPAAEAAPEAAPAEEKPKKEKKAKKAAEPAADAPALPASPKAEKPKKNSNANLPKVDPTWRKHLKAAAKAAGKEHTKEMESGLLNYVNMISNVAFHSKKAEEHIADYLAEQAPAAAAPMVETDLVEQEFQGKTYFVNPETKRVYEVEFEEDGETVKVTVPVGYVGMAAFAEMVLDEE